MVGDVCTTSFIRNWYRIVVLPALSRPTRQSLCSSFPNILQSFARTIPMMLYLQGSWDTTEISVEPIRFLVSLKSKGGGFTYFLSYLKVSTLSSFLFLSCLFKWIHNLLIRQFDSIYRLGYKCTNVSD